MIWSHIFTVNMTDEDKRRIIEAVVERKFRQFEHEIGSLRARIEALENEKRNLQG